MLAGLTAYAVPLVLAATAPVSGLAVQIGALVKLVRVPMLGPLVLALSVFTRVLPNALGTDGSLAPASPRLWFSRLVSWFIMGFLALGALRSLDILIHAVIGPAAAVARPCRCWCWCWAGSASR